MTRQQQLRHKEHAILESGDQADQHCRTRQIAGIQRNDGGPIDKAHGELEQGRDHDIDPKVPG